MMGRSFYLRFIKMKNFFTDKKIYLTAFVILSGVYLYLFRKIIFQSIATLTIERFLLFSLFFTFSMFLALLGREMISNRYPETKGGINYVTAIFALTMNITFLVYTLHGKDYQPTIALMISSVLIGSGWWVQATVGKVTARRSHTINTLMNQRNSALFHDKTQLAREHFGLQKTVNKSLIEYVIGGAACKEREAKQELADAVHALIFIVNYYEFICSSIENEAFDEELIKKCLEEMVVKLEVRAFHLIYHARKANGKLAFCNLVSVVEKWSPTGSLVLRAESGDTEDSLQLVNALAEDYIFKPQSAESPSAN